MLLVLLGILHLAMAGLAMWWARPVGGELSPRLRGPGVEQLYVGMVFILMMAGFGLLLAGFFGSF